MNYTKLMWYGMSLYCLLLYIVRWHIELIGCSVLCWLIGYMFNFVKLKSIVHESNKKNIFYVKPDGTITNDLDADHTKWQWQ